MVFRSPRDDSKWLLAFFQGNYAAAGWSHTVPAEALPKWPRQITAWVFDPDQDLFILLENEDIKEIAVE